MSEYTQIAAAVRSFFEDQNWQYNYSEEDGLFESGVQLDTEPGGAMIHAVVGKAAFTVMVAPELIVEEECFDDLKDFTTLVNARLMLGCLVLDCEEHVLYFRVGQNCAGQVPNAEIVEDAFMYPISFMEDICPILLELLARTISPEDAADSVFEQEN